MNIVNDSQYVPNGCTPNTVNENFNVAITSVKGEFILVVQPTHENHRMMTISMIRHSDEKVHQKNFDFDVLLI